MWYTSVLSSFRPCGLIMLRIYDVITCRVHPTEMSASFPYKFLNLCLKNTTLFPFLRNLANSSSAIAACQSSFATCLTLHSQLYPAPTVTTDSFAPLMGVYPLNVWGMTSIFNWLSTMPSCTSTLMVY